MSTVAVFRPDDGRLDDAVEALRAHGLDPHPDPMLAVEPTGAVPRSDADYVVLTSSTGVERAVAGDWTPGDAAVCAVGPTTASALRDAGYDVALVPDRHDSAGLVDALRERVDGARVEIARSDHGSDVLPAGLADAGAYVHETALYRLRRPPESGTSTEAAAAGDLDGAVFTSRLTVEHFVDAADERGVREAALGSLETAVVGAVGEPTAAALRDAGVPVDVQPDDADVEAVVAGVAAALDA